MNINNQILGTSIYKCDNCSDKIPTGLEKPCWTNDGTHVYKLLFCYICKRGNKLSKPYNFDPKKITESPEFKQWERNTQTLSSLFSEEEAERNRKDLERVRWSLPRINEKG